MKNLVLSLIFSLVSLFSLSSCVATSAIIPTEDGSYIEVQSDVVDYRNIDFNVIVRYGTPYYYNGSLLYYIYNNLYYYPFYYDNYWYVRVYRRPIDHLRYRPYFRPNRHDYRFSPGRHPGYNRPPQRHDSPNRHSGMRHQGPRNHVGAPRTPQSTNRHGGIRHNDSHRDRFGNRR